MSNTGSRAQVFHGNANKTTGGLIKSDLKQNDNGKIVSKKASSAAKKTKNLGEFQANGKGFELAPKKGSKAHKELKSVKKKSTKKKSAIKKSTKKKSTKKKSAIKKSTKKKSAIKKSAIKKSTKKKSAKKKSGKKKSGKKKSGKNKSMKY